MLNEVLFLVWYGSSGSGIGEFLNELAWLGVFDYLLPFLLIFALINGLLNQMKLFRENKGINGIIAFSVGLMALQFDMVPIFFAEVFPRLGVGLAVILLIMITVGFFSPTDNWVKYVFWGAAGIVLITVLYTTAQNLGWSLGYLWIENWRTFAVIIVLVIIIAIIMNAGKTSSKTSPFMKILESIGSNNFGAGNN